MAWCEVGGAWLLDESKHGVLSSRACFLSRLSHVWAISKCGSLELNDDLLEAWGYCGHHVWATFGCGPTVIQT
ncbi:hypothetical protein PIB30_072254, partial [Stylosanthes scabra]|nr:hypothetical protein [Stylosanthes scabra]